MLNLAHSDHLQAGPELEVNLLIQAVMHRTGVDLSGYCRRTLQLHLQRHLARNRLQRISDLLPIILEDDQAMHTLIDALLVTSTAFFHDPQFYQCLRETVLPALSQQPALRIWQIGCASGQETWSLAIVLAEEGLLERTTLVATDTNRHAIANAMAGRYDLHEWEAAELTYRRTGGTGTVSQWFLAEDDQGVIAPSLTKPVIFGLHDAVSDHAFGQWHLILCRNVLMYFSPEKRQHALKLIDQSLEPWGFFAMGSTEKLTAGEDHDGYLITDADHSIFQKRAVKLITAQRTVRRSRQPAELEETVTMPPVNLNTST